MSDVDHTVDTGSDSTDVEGMFVVGPRPLQASRSLSDAGSRSVVIEKAVSAYLALISEDADISPSDFCRDRQFNSSSLRSSIIRQIELEGFLARHSCTLPVEPVSWPKSGDRIGSFTIVEEIGRGGLARVYLCRQPTLGDRHVVLKLGRWALTEAHTLGQLRHPNIVPIHSAEHDAATGLGVLCMPFLGRSTLCDLIDVVVETGPQLSAGALFEAAQKWDRPTDGIGDQSNRAAPTLTHHFERVAYIGARLADALNHAHSQGIVHGDIKPSNVLISRTGEPLLMDFNLSGNAGLALMARGGTIPYMPPEQLHAFFCENAPTPSNYDERSDIFSLGVVLYQLLTGVLPFPVDNLCGDHATLAAQLREQQQQGYRPLRKMGVTTPAGIAATIDRCMELSPEKRYQSAAELCLDLEREIRPLRKWRRRIAAKRRSLAPVAAIVAMALFLCVAAMASRPPAEVRDFERAKAMRNAGDHAGATTLLQRAISVAPTFDEARFALGRELLTQGQIHEALDHFFIMADKRKDPASKAYVAYCLSLEGKFTDAIPWYQAALDAGYDLPEVHNNLAVAFELGSSALSQGERSDAIESHLTAALGAVPKSPTIRMNSIVHQMNAAQRRGAVPSAETIAASCALATEFPRCGIANMTAAMALTTGSAAMGAAVDQAAEFLICAIYVGDGPDIAEFSKSARWRQLRSSTAANSIYAAISRAEVQVANSDRIPRLLEPVPKSPR